jgi:hypothetical protein
MGLSVYLFAGPKDYRAFSEYSRSTGLRMYSILVDQPEETSPENPSLYPFVYLSPHAREELHPYGQPPGIGPATEPLLELMKPYFKDNVLVIGRIYCSNDLPQLFAVTKPWFMRLRKWIKNEWERLPTGQYIGPEAKELEHKGAKLAYFPPGVTLGRN